MVHMWGAVARDCVGSGGDVELRQSRDDGLSVCETAEGVSTRRTICECTVRQPPRVRNGRRNRILHTVVCRTHSGNGHSSILPRVVDRIQCDDVCVESGRNMSLKQD